MTLTTTGAIAGFPVDVTARAQRCRGAAHACAWAVAVIGAAAVIGWLADIAALRSLLPGFPEMRPATALALVLAGVSLLLATATARRAAARVLAALVLAAALAALALGGLAAGPTTGGVAAGLTSGGLAAGLSSSGLAAAGMPTFAVASFLLLAPALLALDARHAVVRRMAPWLAQGAAVLSLILLTGYAYEVSSLYRAGAGSPVALPAAIAFLLLSAGVLLARPERDPVARMLAADAGGRLLRRLLPAAMLVPPLLGWLFLQGHAAGAYGLESGIAAYAATTVGVLALLVWGAATQAHHFDIQQRAAEARVVAQLARLGLLAHITRAIAARHDAHSIFQVVVRSLEDHLPIDFGCILLHDAASGTLTVDAAGTRGATLAADLALAERARLDVDADGLDRCLRGHLVHEPDVAAVQRPFAQRLAAGGLRALVLSPLLVEGRTIGLLAVARRAAGSFSSGDCEFLHQLAEHVALATQQAQLRDALQRAYDDLRRSQDVALQQERLRALGQMASGIAHDINNAISPLTLLLEYLQEHERTIGARGREALQHIARGIDDVAATVARMRDFYRPRDARLVLAPVALNPIVRQVVDLTRARWNDMPLQRGIVIRLHTELAAELPRLHGVDSELREALINLVFNAVDAMPRGGTITLRTAALTDGGTRLEISDTGTGMDEDTRRRCLEPFFTTKGERGTGLGLAMVYGTIERHGATLDIRSAPGHGTTFAVNFPPAPAGPTAGPAADAPHAKAPAQKPPPLRILLVDDDPMVLATLKTMLEIDGHQVVEAGSGQHGIDTFERELSGERGIELVMTDLGMPYVDGHQVARRVKALSPATPVVMLTGWGAQGLDGAANGGEHIDVVLSKPPKMAELRSTLRALAAR